MDTGIVLAIQVAPSLEVAATVPAATDKNIVPFAAIATHPAEDGMVLVVHVTPSVDVSATELAPPLTVQNVVPRAAILRLFPDVFNVLAVHVIPSSDVAATLLGGDEFTMQNTTPFHAIPDQLLLESGVVPSVSV